VRAESEQFSIFSFLRRFLSGGWLCALLFVALGSLFINRTGVEEDETMFASPLYRDWCFFSIPLKHGRIPIMHMSYVGALKTWAYTPIAAVWSPSAAMLRVPALLIGALTILLFWKLLDSVHGRRAAWAGGLLLATDAVFLLTNVFDWGPVAIQHLLLMAMLLAGVRWSQTGRAGWLFGAAFCCGLAFWDKAVFVWMFCGLVAGSLIFWRRMLGRLTGKSAAVAVLGLCLGASPLIYYNLSTDPKFLTFRSNTKFTPNHFAERFQLLRKTWNGPALFGYMVYETSDRPNSPSGAVERASFALHQAAGNRRTGYFEPALLASLLLFPLLWRTPARKTLLFAAIAGAVAWTAMVLLDGGSSAHHAILLWPLPQWFVAVSFAEASRHVRFGKWALGAAAAFLMATNLLVANQYLFQFIRNGAAGSWTEAIYPLAAALRQTQASQLGLVDWGFQDPLSFLNQEKPSERVIADPFMPAGEPAAQKQADLQLLFDANAIWVEHAPGSEVSQGINDRLLRVTRDAGLEQVMLGTFCDRNGRPVFQTFRFAAKR
jgi:dolichyl-phosphate-mannose-protein mannosyltransferase